MYNFMIFAESYGVMHHYSLILEHLCHPKMVSYFLITRCDIRKVILIYCVLYLHRRSYILSNK